METTPPPPGTTLHRFRVAVEAAGSRYHELAGWDDVAALAAAGRGTVAVAPSLAAGAPSLLTALQAAGAPLVRSEGDDPAAAVADVDTGVVRGELGVAETGSVLVSEHAVEDRVVSMLCRRLVQVVARDAVVDRLDAVATWLSERAGQPGFVSLMTGPSRTADIERTLTVGVQGPDAVEVLVLG
jgi:L-lactate dehydrogenase complex protein LldG